MAKKTTTETTHRFLGPASTNWHEATGTSTPKTHEGQLGVV